MTTSIPRDQRQIVSTIQANGQLEISLRTVPMPELGEHDVLVRIEAAPINPSDLLVLFGMADVSQARFSGSADAPIVHAPVSATVMPMLSARVAQPMVPGNEGAGRVVATGSDLQAQALMGRTVAMMGGSMFSEYRSIPASDCLPLPEGTTAIEGASCFVNPLTSLGMVQTMRAENHRALVHTAAASNLGQMLNKLCLAESVDLVNIVRKPEQVALLREQGARYVVNSAEPDFMASLIDALTKTGASLAFDAIGGGPLTDSILTAMEVALSRSIPSQVNQYGSTMHKQVYIYGGLDRHPTPLNRTYGMAWGIGGWLLPFFLHKVGPQAAQQLRERVAAEIKTTFASHYTDEVSLAGALSESALSTYRRQATGQKYLIRPTR